MKMSSIIINGKSYIGSQVSVNGNKITINGTNVTHDTKIVNISIEGDVDYVTADYCEKIIVKGNVKTVCTTSGDIECHDVAGDVKLTSGDVQCGNIGGSVQTVSGDVKAENISGSVKTLSGDIKYKK